MARARHSVRTDPPDVDASRADVVADLFRRAARANRRSRRRRGASVHLPRRGRIVLSGDLHDHEANFARLVRLARLGESRYHHLVLHEIIHGEELSSGVDYSVRMLARAAALKLRYPSQVHLMMGNHELAQLHREGIYKGDVALVDAFADGVERLYRADAERVREAMHELIRSLLLAVRCANGIVATHSLPGRDTIDGFDPAVLDRPLTDEDLAIGGHAYNLVWGRDHDAAIVDRLARAWGAAIFVIGHEPAEAGFVVRSERLLVLASDHEQGVGLPVRLSRTYDMDGLVASIVRLAELDEAEAL